MEVFMEDIIKELTKLGKTISTMESCTGGGVSNAITNVEGASEVFKYGAVTYSNEFKIKMGVSSDIIDKYSVYSMEVAKEMALNISKFANSNYGVGITGKINRIDKNNLYGENNIIYISIYDRDNDKYYNKEVKAIAAIREENKRLIIKIIEEVLLSVIE